MLDGLLRLCNRENGARIEVGLRKRLVYLVVLESRILFSYLFIINCTHFGLESYYCDIANFS